MTDQDPVDRLTAVVAERIARQNREAAMKTRIRNNRLAGLLAFLFLAFLFLGRTVGWW